MPRKRASRICRKHLGVQYLVIAKEGPPLILFVYLILPVHVPLASLLVEGVASLPWMFREQT